MQEAPKAPFSREDWEAWRDNPLSRWVFQVMSEASHSLKEQWVEASWNRGQARTFGPCKLTRNA